MYVQTDSNVCLKAGCPSASKAQQVERVFYSRAAPDIIIYIYYTRYNTNMVQPSQEIVSILLQQIMIDTNIH